MGRGEGVLLIEAFVPCTAVVPADDNIYGPKSQRLWQVSGLPSLAARPTAKGYLQKVRSTLP